MRPLESLKLEVSLEVLRKYVVVAMQLPEQLKLQRLFRRPNAPTQQPHAEILSPVPFQQELVEVLTLLLADVEVAQQVVDGLHRYHSAYFFELGLEAGLEVQVRVAVAHQPLGQQRGVALDEDILVDQAAEYAEDVLHFLLEPLLLQLFVPDYAIRVLGQYVRNAIGAVVAVKHLLYGKLVAELYLVVAGKALFQLLGLVLVVLEQTSDELHLALQLLVVLRRIHCELFPFPVEVLLQVLYRVLRKLCTQVIEVV